MMAKHYNEWTSRTKWLIPIVLLLAGLFTIGLKPFFAPSVLSLTLNKPHPDHYQVYINSGRGYNEHEQRSVEVGTLDPESTLKFFLPARRIHGLRLDPGTASADISIGEACLISWKGSTCWNAEALLRLTTPISGITASTYENNALKLTLVGPDPALALGPEIVAAHARMTRLPSLLVFVLGVAALFIVGAVGPPLYRLIAHVSEIRPRDHSTEQLFALTLTFAFLIAAGFTALHHEMWRDELHTWIVGRESHSLLQMYQNTRYDGHGFMWYLMVWPLTRISENPAAMQVLHLAFAVTTAYLLARFSPFSRVQRVLLVFGYLFFYEYTIIARNYALGVLFLTTFCVVFAQSPKRFVAIGIILALMANTSSHALILSVGLAIGYAVYLWRDGILSRPLARSLSIGAVIFALGVCVEIFIALPPSDLGLDYADRATTLEWPRIVRVFGLFESAFLAKRPDLGISGWSLLPLVFVFRWARQPGVLLFFLSSCGTLFILFYFIYFGSPRHHGFVFLALVAALWLAAYQVPVSVSDRAERIDLAWQRISGIVFSVMLCFHAYSGYLSTHQDIVRVVSNGKVTARYLETNGLDQLPIVAFADWPTTSVLGYLSNVRQVYHPQGHRWASHVVQDSSRLNWPSQEEVINEASSLSGERIILLMNVPISDELVHQKGLRPLAQFTGAGIASENFYLYLIEKLGNN